MLSRLSLFFIAVFFQLPLFILHGLGELLGLVAYQFDRRFKERIDANLKHAFISSDENNLKNLHNYRSEKLANVLRKPLQFGLTHLKRIFAGSNNVTDGSMLKLLSKRKRVLFF